MKTTITNATVRVRQEVTEEELAAVPPLVLEVGGEKVSVRPQTLWVEVDRPYAVALDHA